MFDLEGDAESLKSPKDPDDVQVIEFGALMMMESTELVTSDAPLDFAFTWNVYVVSEVTAAAVPDITPLALSVKPGGNAPETRVVSYSTA
jgi:hypothetical protein